MAKKSGGSKPKGAPHLSAALICEKVLVEADKVPSYMRVVDQVTLTRLPGQDAIPHGSGVSMNLNLVLTFRGAGFQGKLPLKIERVGPPPAKERALLIEHEMEFGGQEEGGSTVGIGLHMKWAGEGVYWFDVFLAGALRTSVPLRINVARPPLADSTPKSKGWKTKKI